MVKAIDKHCSDSATVLVLGHEYKKSDYFERPLEVLI